MITLIIKALNYAKPSPAPASQRLSGKKVHHFELLFSSKIHGEHEMMLFQNRKNKIIFGPKIHGERIKNDRFVFVFFAIKFDVFLQLEMVIQIYQGDIFALIHHPFLMKFDDFSMKFDENYMEKIDTPVCELNFSCQISVFMIFHDNQ